MRLFQMCGLTQWCHIRWDSQRGFIVKEKNFKKKLKKLIEVMSATGRLSIHFLSYVSECRVMSSFPANTDGKVKEETN